MAINQSNRLMLVSALAALSATAQGAFTGLTIEIAGAGPSGVLAYRVYAEFSSPTDELLSVTEADITTFLEPLYQHPLGGVTEPNPALFPIFPDLVWDSFVTIGLTQQQPGVVPTQLEPGSVGFDAEGFEGGWYGSSRSTAGIAGKELRVLIAQLSFEDPDRFGCVEAALVVLWKEATGSVMVSDASFGTGLSGCPPFWYGDLVFDGVVDGLDLAYLLGEWGACDSCPADLNGDDVVNGLDLAILLGLWD